jgi:2-iminobutanoate/2-iminopropanoate deaminase
MDMRKVLIAGIALFLASTAGAQSRTVVSTTGNSPTLSAAIRVGDMLYISGQLPSMRPPADTTIQGQTKSALDKVKAIVDSAGTKMENVVKCTVFLISQADFQGMNQAYTQFWPKEPPTRSTVVVAALVSNGPKLEIECMATFVR